MPKMRILDTLCLDFNGIVKFFRRTRLRLFNPWREKYGLDIQLINYGHPAWLSILKSRSGYLGPAVKPRASVHRAAGYDRGVGLGRDTASCEGLSPLRCFRLDRIHNARMAKLADAADLKSAGRKAGGVQVPLRAPTKQRIYGY